MWLSESQRGVDRSRTPARFFSQAVLLGFLCLGAGCASVPTEVVTLSETLGADLEQVHTTYRALIREHFAGLRAQAANFIEYRWMPAYLRDFIESGGLVQMAQGADSVEVYESVSVWAEVAMEEIEAKRKMLVVPIDEDEQALLAAVDEAFLVLGRANATLTEYLRSLAKVKAMEDETLAGLHLKDLRDTVTDRLAGASERAAKALSDLELEREKLDEAAAKAAELKSKLKGGKSDGGPK